MNDEMVELGPIDYLVVEFPADKANFSGAMAEKLMTLVEAGTVRVLDLLIITKDEGGEVDAFELHEFEGGDAGALRDLGAEFTAAALRGGRRPHRRGARARHRGRGAGLGEHLGGAVRGLDPRVRRPAGSQRPHPHAGDPRRRRGGRGRRTDGRSLTCLLDQDAEDPA